MSKSFFSGLVDNNLFVEWCDILDWIFDDNKFEGWSSGYVGLLTKKIKRLPNIGDKTYSYDCIKNLKFPQKGKKRGLKILISNGSSETKDLIRHFRNGIAHGHATLFSCKGELFIEIIDYNKQHEQTAYISMPLNYIVQIYKLYGDVEKSMKNLKKK